MQGGRLKKGGIFAGGWEAFGREGKFGGKEGELQDGSLSWPRGGDPGPGGALALSGEGRISGGDGGGLRVDDERRRNFSSECFYFPQ